MKPKFEQDLVICSCGDVSHQLIISTFEYVNSKGENEIDCFIQIHLNKHNFWNRLKIAIKYIFGLQSKFGAFEEIVVDKKNAEKIKNCMQTYLTKSEKAIS